jgi:hypothetical protein
VARVPDDRERRDLKMSNPLLKSKHIRAVNQITSKQTKNSLKLRFDVGALVKECLDRDMGLKDIMRMVEDEAVVAILMDNDWNQRESAQVAKVHFNVINRHLKRWAETVGKFLK